MQKACFKKNLDEIIACWQLHGKTAWLARKGCGNFYGIAYEHTFAVVDFGKEPNYEIILGRPFMRQMKMIQDWGYNYIYLCQPNATTYISLKDHSYKDVNYTPVRDMVSVIEKNDFLPSWLVHQEPVWLFDVKE